MATFAHVLLDNLLLLVMDDSFRFSAFTFDAFQRIADVLAFEVSSTMSSGFDDNPLRFVSKNALLS
jgi:hypothetical protein